MDQSNIIQITSEVLLLVLWLSMPPILVATVVGLLVSLLQALTQLQEQTLPFAIKLVAVIITILATASWLGGELYAYTINIFDHFPRLAQ
ncbi:MAG: type III secretion system export apparatus subunit SctS [Verrucomicrobiales bacterium]|nr:type III secretion system export apparatus subunit SctS [Verrucomicrobiales bacterium]